MSCAEVVGEDSYCFVYIKEDNSVMKGCLEYGAEGPNIMTSVWPEEMKCITVLDGESKGGGWRNTCKNITKLCFDKVFQMVTAASVWLITVIPIFVRLRTLMILLTGICKIRRGAAKRRVNK